MLIEMHVADVKAKERDYMLADSKGPCQYVAAKDHSSWRRFYRN